MRLDRLINDLEIFDRPAEARKVEITKVTEDTRTVTPGALFCCVPGATRDGHDLAAEAVSKGAVALVVERELDIDVPRVRVPNVRAALGPLSAAFYDHPDRYLRMIGITGTSGKTSTTELLAGILQNHKWKTATIGTLSQRFSTPTTPPAPELQEALAEFRNDHYNAVVMEVTSQALDQRRVDAIQFAAAVFTNFSQDHLDYHKTMNQYFEAKTLLFEPGRSKKAIINVDDEWGRKLIERVAIPVTEYSINDVESLDITTSHSTFVWQGEEILLPLVGRFNVYNALAAATTARALGVPVATIANALRQVSPIPGRVQKVDCGQPFAVLVDYSHKPGALENALQAASDVASRQKGRVLLVFGAGGDRDREKRPLMGEVAQRLADVAFLTNDNPRTEDPEAIAQQVLAGMSSEANVHVELDRAKAISLAVKAAEPGDVVLIAGKGDETYQEIHGVKHPFDDREIAARALRTLGERGDKA